LVSIDDADSSSGVGINQKYFRHINLDIPFILIESPVTAEPTPTRTPTPTFTPTVVPTSTYTSTPTITAELTGYGSFSSTQDFVKFKLSYTPPSGTFTATVNGLDYACALSSTVANELICQGYTFPSGMYVDVILFYNGTVI
jgi:hypothetical protein